MTIAYVGTYTTPGRNGHGNGINAYKVDARSGAFRHIQTLGGLENPSFLAIDRTQRFLYSVHGDRSEATAYAIDPRTGHLRVLNRQSTGGTNPAQAGLGVRLASINSNFGQGAAQTTGKASDLMIQGDADNFVERTVRITQLPRAAAEKARVAMLMATPKKTGRVTPTIESVPAQDD